MTNATMEELVDACDQRDDVSDVTVKIAYGIGCAIEIDDASGHHRFGGVDYELQPALKLALEYLAKCD